MRWFVALALSTSAALSSLSALAQDRGPVLHTHVSFDPADDARMKVSRGSMGSIQTPEGLVPASSDSSGKKGPLTSPNFDGGYVPDRQTKAPDILPVSDVFRPSIAPYKRLAVFDSVANDFTLHVERPALVEQSIQKGAVDGSDRFDADIQLVLRAGAPVRIPSVSAGSKIVQAALHDAAGRGISFRLFADGAENWFVQAAEAGAAKLTLTIMAPRSAFGGSFSYPAKFSDYPATAALPPVPKAATARVLQAMGITKNDAPVDAVRKMVSYFRGFHESEQSPTGNGDIYQDIALSKKGVCRHRAFAFLVTALGLGLPARMVLNEEHAWVEVRDSRGWKKIDLGGGGHMLFQPKEAAQQYEEEPDPYKWPVGSRSGRDTRATQHGSGGGTGNGSGGNSSNMSMNASDAGVGGSDQTSDETKTVDKRDASKIHMIAVEREAFRGDELHVSGTVEADGKGCPNVVVEFFLHRNATELVPAGVLSTDAKGAYNGTVRIPAGAQVGEQAVLTRTAGGARCGPSPTDGKR